MKNLAAPLESAVRSGHILPLWFFEGLFGSGPLRLWNGLRARDWDGKTWSRSGGLIQLGRMTETTETRRTRLSFRLAGLDPEINRIIRNERYQGRSLNIWFGAEHPTSGEILDTPHQTYAGFFDQFEVTDARASVTVTGTAFGLFDDLNKAPGHVWDDETHQEEFPGDTIFRRLADLQDTTIEIEKRPS